MTKPSCLAFTSLANFTGRSPFRTAALLALIALFAPIHPNAMAQLLYGSLVGNVNDTTAATVTEAKVTITDPGTGLTRQTTTSDKGEYGFTSVPVGTYDLTVSHEGFKEFVRARIELSAGGSVRADATLAVGEVTQRVEVNADVAVLQTDRAEVKGQVESTQYKDLPVPPARDYEELLSTIPGVTPVTSAQALENSPARAMSFEINGQSGATRTTRIDGAAEINTFLPTTSAYIPSLEAIQEVSVTTNSPDAELAGAAGGAINISIKSGTNRFHGSLFAEHSDAAMLASPAILPAGEKKAGYTFNQFGGSLGGPIKKDKLFFFLSSDNTFSRNHTSAFYTVPTLAQKEGNLSISSTPIYDPLTGTVAGTGRTAFPGNMIPQSRLDPIMGKILALLPAPNLPGTLNNYFISTPINRTTQVIDAKINWNPTPKASLYGRSGTVNAVGFTGNVFDGQDIGGPIEGGNIWGVVYSTTFAGTYTFTPNLLLDANFGWTEMNNNIEPFDIGKNLGLEYGIPGTNGTTRLQSGWPQFVPQTYTVFGMNAQWMPWYRSDPQWNTTGNMTWIHRTHQVRFGVEVLKQQLNHDEADQEAGGPAYGAQGGFGFAGQLTTLSGGPSSNQFNSMASMLLGEVSTAGKDVLQGEETTRQEFYSAYVRDQWQVSSKLTVTLGVRWEYLPLLSRADRGVETYNFANNTVNLCGVGGNAIDCGVHESKHDFEPRAGLAYRVTPTFVIRAGYGLGFDPTPLVRQYISNYPQLVTFYLQSGANSANAYTPISTIEQGLPAIPLPSLTSPVDPVGGNVTVGTVPQDFHRGYIQSWNFTLEKQLTNTMSLAAGYVGTRVNGQLTSLDANAGDLGCAAACQPLNVAFGRTAVTDISLPIGNGHYDALQAHFQKRFSGGFSLGSAFTWSKDLAQNTSSGNGVASAAYALPKYGYLYYGPTSDPSFYLNVNGSADLPFGKNKRFLNTNSLANTVLGGWKLTGIYSINGGNKFGITSSSATNAVDGPTQRANVVYGVPQILGGLGPGNNYVNPAAFVAGPANQIGTAGPDILTGPKAFNLDANLSRIVKVTEKFTAELRAEAFNISNTPHWGTPGGNVSTGAAYATITAVRQTGRDAGDQRQLQFGVRVRF